MTEVIVFAAPNRAAHEKCFASIEASDIGKNYVVSMHPEGVSRNDHWLATHQLACRASSEFVVVLEDDVLVNRYILENVDSWRWKEHKDFGAGWIYNAGGYSDRDTWYRGPQAWAMTPGVVYRTSELPKLIQIAWLKMHDHNPMPWDCAIAYAAHGGGKRIRVHYPSLVEHQNEFPSVLGNPSKSVLRTSRGTFRQDFRRPAGHEHGYFDQYGRRRSMA